MKRTFFQAAFTLWALAAGDSVFAATPVGGFITTNTHWNAAGSPYIASSSILVDSGATLTIDPGVEVRFAQTTGLVIVNGTLSARGTSSLPILFTADQPGDANRWNGIRFGSNTVDAVLDGNGGYLSGSIIEHSTVRAVARHPNGAIRIESSAPLIQVSAIRDNLSCGIVAVYADGLHIVDNQIQNNTGLADAGGVDLLFSDDVILMDNDIVDNTGRSGGLFVADGSNALIKANTFSRNIARFASTSIHGAGFFLQGTRNLTVSDNVVSDNEGEEPGASAVAISDGMNVMLVNNTIAENLIVDAGLGVQGGSGISLNGTRIVNNSGHGIHFAQGYSTSNVVISTIPLNPTVILGNSGYQILNDQLFEVSTDPLATGNVDARNVWWGTIDMPTIEAGVFDFFDNSFKGIVFIDPIARSESPNGDFNGDNVVDAADYIVWRTNGGTASDYNLWRATFGMTLGGGSGSASTNVPEPMPLLFTMLGIAIALFDRTPCRVSYLY